MDSTRLGELAVERGLVAPEDLARCLKLQEASDPPRYLGEVLVAEGALKASALQHLLTALHRTQPEASVYSSKETAERLRDADLNGYLEALVKLDAQELHVAAGARPQARCNGRLLTISPVVLSSEACRRLLAPLLASDTEQQFLSRRSIDRVHALPDGGRFRAHLFMQSRGPAAVFCRIPDAVPTVEELRLPPIVKEVPRLSNGLVLVTGPGASGKSTTLAALVELLNDSRRRHVVTLEQPVEFLHRSRYCLISQREVGRHVADWDLGLRTALREDPDVIVVGDLDGPGRVATALTAAETGQLVLGTMRTPSAQTTLLRILESYSGGRREMVRAMLAALLRFVLSQQLLPDLRGERLHLAVEVLRNTSAVAALIREGRLNRLQDVMQTSRDQGMVLMDASLRELVERGEVSVGEAMARAADPHQVLGATQRRGS